MLCHFMKKGHRSDLVSAVRVGSLRRQFLSAFCAPSLQDETATFRLHALTETMRLLTPMVIRLIRHLHQDPPPQKNFKNHCLSSVPYSQNTKEHRMLLRSILTTLNYSLEITECQGFSMLSDGRQHSFSSFLVDEESFFPF